MNRWRGVNLGNWLVLEKWMSPALFADTDAEDEYYLARTLPPEIYKARMEIHRSSYITERDFARIAEIGLNAVRIPIPYFIWGDRPPFPGCLTELDHAFDWAEKYGLRILIDLHTVPLSQNGFDNGGICGVCRWSQTPEEVEFVLTLLEKLARRYGKRPGLMGIEPINEPVTEPAWTTMGVPARYPARDPALAAGSAPNTLEFVQGFYAEAYRRIRPHLSDDQYVVFHDAFQLDAWEPFFRDGNYKNVILDTHQYLMMAEMQGCPQTLEGYEAFIRGNIAPKIAAVQKYVDVICGEWCLFNSYAVGSDTQGGKANFEEAAAQPDSRFAPEQLRQIYRRLAQVQTEAWAQGSGYFYWSYKLLLDTVHQKNWQGWDCWDLGKSVSLGWFPTPAE